MSLDIPFYRTLPQLYQYSGAFAMVDGVITLHYTLKAGSGAKRKDQVVRVHSVPKAHPENEPRWEDMAGRISDPAIRKQFLADLLKAKPELK
jgi:hypothetical protein